MAALPALTKTYSTRANVPYPNVSSVAHVRASFLWLLKAALMDQLSTGTLVGSRNANSVWTCDHSCDGTTAGTPADGVDRWTGTYDISKIVGASVGVAHSWIVLRNTASGLYLCIDFNSAGASARFAVSKTSFSGGTTTAGPTSANEFQFGSTGTSNSTTYNFSTDEGTGNVNYAHFTATDDGRFFFEVSRAGLGVFSSVLFLLPSVGGRVSDTNNWFAIAAAAASGRGGVGYNALQQVGGCVSRTPNNSGVVTTGGAGVPEFGNTAYPGTYGVDGVSGDYMAFPIFVMSLGPQVAYRGQLEDTYLIGTAAVGASVPSAAAQQRVVVGDVVVPFNGTPPIV